MLTFSTFPPMGGFAFDSFILAKVTIESSLLILNKILSATVSNNLERIKTSYFTILFR